MATYLCILTFYVNVWIYGNSFVACHPDGRPCELDKKGQSSCSQLCVESATSAVCACKDGYRLADDQHTCIIKGEEPRMVLVTGNATYFYHVESSFLEASVNISSGIVTNIGFGPQSSLFVTGDNGTVIYRSMFDRKQETPTSVIDTGLGYVVSLAVDWFSLNLYLIDRTAGKIIVCDIRGDNCADLLSNLHQPSSIVVDTDARSLLWSQFGMGDHLGSVHTGKLDGSHQSVMVSMLCQPRGLVLDRTVNRLFWLAKMDGSDVVQSMDLNGKNIMDIMKSKFVMPCLSVLTDHLYITDADRLMVVNKFTGAVIYSDRLAVGNISVSMMYHPVLYSAGNTENPCGSSPCSHVCVPAESSRGFKCLCPRDMILTSQLVQCKGKHDAERLLISGPFGLYEVPLDFVGYHSNRERKLMAGDISSIVYDQTRDRVFCHDDALRAIIMVDLKTEGPVAMTLFTNVFAVEGLAYDFTSQNLYWSTRKGDVYVGRADGSFSTLLISQLDQPRGISLSPDTGYMYVADWGKQPQIARCQMDGSNCETFIEVDGGHPNMVTIATPIKMESSSKNTLYYTDSKLDQIGYVTLDTTSRGFIPLSHIKDCHPFNLVVTNTTIYFTDLNTRHAHYVSKSDLTKVEDIRLGAGMLLGLDHTQKSQEVLESPCSLDNGDCLGMCLPKPGGRKSCLCPAEIDKNICSGKSSSEEMISVNQTVKGDKLKNADLQTTKQNSVLTATKQSRIFTTELTNTSRLKIMSESYTSSTLLEDRTPDAHKYSEKNNTTPLVIVVVISASLVLVLIGSIVTVCLLKRKQLKRDWRLVRYFKASQREDVKSLVSNSTSTLLDANFKQFEDVDYPEESYSLGRLRSYDREMSMISTDSAFTEMKDFDNYCSNDNLVQ